MRLQESSQTLAAFCGKDGAGGMENAHWKGLSRVSAEEGKVKWLEDSRGPVIYAVQGEGLSLRSDAKFLSVTPSVQCQHWAR